MFEITPVLDKQSDKPLFVQLCNYIKQEIVSGRIQPKEKLPSKRKLSKYLGLSINTIQAAYDQLCAEGYVESKLRQGFYITELHDELFPLQLHTKEIETKREQVQTNIEIDFNSGKIDLGHFPFSIWRKLSIQSLYEDQGDLFYNGDPQGEFHLRNEIAKHLFASRGVKSKAEQIIIGAGTQVLMGLLCLIIGKKHTYAVENPGFHRTKFVLKEHEVNLKPIPIDKDGVDVKQLYSSNATIAYVTPSHQFPYGMIMPIARRMELLKWAEEKNGYIIEDDYDGEYRYKGTPIPSLQGLDTKGNVIYLGTFSKSLIPSIRISFMVLPEKLIQKYKDHFTIYKQTASRLHQNTLFRFMNEGYFQSHLNKMRTLYRKKQLCLLTAIRNYLGNQVNVIGEKSGLHIVLEVHNKMSEEELINRAMNVGVKVYPLSLYYDSPQESKKTSVLLGFGGLSEHEIEKGIWLLKEAWAL